MLDRHDAAEVARMSLRALVALMTPLTVFGLVILEPFLRAWVGDEIGRSSAPVGEILLLGIWLNSLAMVPYALLQAQRRPDLPAKFHLLEVAPYIGGLALGLHLAGIRGAAWAWTGRAAADAILLFWAARATSAPTRPVDLREIFEAGIVVLVACICSLTLFGNDGLRIVIGFVLVCISLWIGWRLAGDHLRGLRGAIARAWRQ
jgi:O-antigen/teichoic acid export membrane protein